MSVRLMQVAVLAACVALAAGTAIAAEKATTPDFKKMDANGDNKATEAEFDAYVIACPELGLAKTVFQSWDKDKDGTVTIEEFELVQPIEKKAGPAKSSCGVKAAEKQVEKK